MCKCIYCNSADLTISDIITLGLTGASLTRKFVCYEHNQFTNDQFEKTAVANWDFFRNSLGLTERYGNEIKYKADLSIEGITVPNVLISGRSSIYRDKKRLFKSEQDGKKSYMGNIDKLKQMKGANDSNIKILDTSTTVVSVRFTLEKLLASEEMLHTIAKIAYEWHCYIHNINEYIPPEYSDIIDVILMNKPISGFVETVVSAHLDTVFEELCSLGTHSLFEYTDADGYEYVIYNFWGIMVYKIKIRNTGAPNLSQFNEQHLYSYNIDGSKNQTTFASIGVPHFASMSPLVAIAQHRDYYTSKLDSLVKTVTLSIRKVKSMTDELNSALRIYKKAQDFERLVDYENPDRVYIIYLLSLLKENEAKYDFGKSFNENLASILECSDTKQVSEHDKQEYLQELLKLHNNNLLVGYIENGISFFETIYVRECSSAQKGNDSSQVIVSADNV